MYYYFCIYTLIIKNLFSGAGVHTCARMGCRGLFCDVLCGGGEAGFGAVEAEVDDFAGGVSVAVFGDDEFGGGFVCVREVEAVEEEDHVCVLFYGAAAFEVFHSGAGVFYGGCFGVFGGDGFSVELGEGYGVEVEFFGEGEEFVAGV